MTNNQKILLGLSAVALAYYFYTKKKGGSASNQGNVNNPQRPYMPQVQSSPQGSCFYKSGISTALGKLENGKCVPAPIKIVVYTCKDGKKYEVDETFRDTSTEGRMMTPCDRNNGGVLNTTIKK